jgi:4-diphosphocytidyl-2-C-methyl-D-erythritol kinase
MEQLTLLAPAKINLHLEILGDRSDGYHELVMIMQTLDLSDRVRLQRTNHRGITIDCDHPAVPKDQKNLAYKAAALLQSKFQIAQGVNIAIDKFIPVEAGLAGGSTDGAAVLVGLNQLWELGLTSNELEILGAQLGSDVPFCVRGGTAIATGRGEQLDSITDLSEPFVLLAKYNHISVSTPWAYQTYRQHYHGQYLSGLDAIQARTHQVHAGDLVQAIEAQNIAAIGGHLYNDLEKVVLPAYPAVQALRDVMANLSPLGAMMSGSGPTIFGLFPTKTSALEAEMQLKTQLPDPNLGIWATKINNTGISLLNPG